MTAALGVQNKKWLLGAVLRGGPQTAQPHQNDVAIAT